LFAVCLHTHANNMTELKRAMASFEEVKAQLAEYVSAKEADQPRQIELGHRVCAQVREIEGMVEGIRARYNKSVQGNGSIYGPKTTAKIKAFLEDWSAMQQTIAANGLDYAPNESVSMESSSSKEVIDISMASSAETTRGINDRCSTEEVMSTKSSTSQDPNGVIGKLVLEKGERFSDAQLNQAIQQQEKMTEKIASLPPGMVRDRMSASLVEIQRCLNRIEKKRAKELEKSQLFRDKQRPPLYHPPEPGYPYPVPPYPGHAPGYLPNPGGIGPGGHFGGDLIPGGGFGGQGGSLLGPGHPLFNGGDYFGGDVNGGKGRGGRPPGVPPGARFDPFGPGVPGFPPARGGGRGGPPGSGFPGTEPFL